MRGLGSLSCGPDPEECCELRALCGETVDAGNNENEAANKNDITMN